MYVYSANIVFRFTPCSVHVNWTFVPHPGVLNKRLLRLFTRRRRARTWNRRKA